MTAFFHFSLPCVNIVVLAEYHFPWMHEQHFSFMPRFPETHTGSDTLMVALAHWQAVRAELRRHLLMKRAKDSLMLCGFTRLIPAALCSSRLSSTGLSHQIRNGTKLEILKQSPYHVCLLFVDLITYLFHYVRLIEGAVRN